MEAILEVYNRMPEENKAWLSVDSIEKDAAEIDAGKGYGYLACEKEHPERIGGVFTATVPGLSADNMGRHIGFPDEKLLQVVHMDTAVVLPEYRGMGLQRRMIEMGEEDLKARGYHYLFGTVHPDNSYSRRNLEKLGYRKVWQGLKYGGLLRDLMLKEV